MTGSVAIAHTVVDTAAGLRVLIDTLLAEPMYALDTEFHREKTYFPAVALLQFGWQDQIALVDPLAVDISPLAELLASDVLCVVHACQQDLDVLQRSCGTVPSRLFDTQLAAGFLGYASPSLANLLSSEMGLKVMKADRLTDWLRRPLTAEQESYAASDVAHLLELYRLLVDQLTTVGRLEWAVAECEALRLRPAGPGDPDEAWWKLKDSRGLRGKGRSVAQTVTAWREQRAAETDQPVRFVLPDLAISALAQKPPRTLDDLRSLRGLDDRHRRGPAAAGLLAAVERGLALDPADLREPRTDDVDRQLRPAVTLVSAWVSQLARDQKIDTALLATRNDLNELLNGAPGARLAVGWRADVLGDDIQRLVKGEAAISFDGKGNLRLLPV